MTESPRKLAYDVLVEVMEKGAYANLALDKALFSCDFDERDKRLITEIVYGTIKYKGHIDYVLDQYTERPLRNTDRKALIILEMASYQLLFMDKIPDHALINESVELAKAVEKEHLTGFINGILRSLARAEKEIVWPDKHKQRSKYLAAYYSFPQWIIDVFLQRAKAKDAEKICRYFNQPAPLWVRTQTLKISPEALKKQLEEEGVRVFPSTHLAEGLKLVECGSLREKESFRKGEFIVQDESSMLVAPALAPQKGERILDVCAAPGGKTTHIAQLMADEGEIIACDIHEHRLGLIKENAKKLNLQSIKTKAQDATKLPNEWQGAFDRVLVDAPCSGLGVLNRRADSRWQKKRNDITGLVEIQKQILAEAARVLKPGGVLVYSTCTITKEENEKQVAEFLETHPDFHLDTTLGESWANVSDCEKGYRLFLPNKDHMDGFFIARFKKDE